MLPLPQLPNRGNKSVHSLQKQPGELSVKTFFISTYGCQMNVNDTERMACLLEMAGYALAPSPEMANLILINSCSIREKPVHKGQIRNGPL